ncbi:MAG: hypothetical protein QOH32_356 [Bradyrhizobium sp.]|jgi:hypothetical protein|nr:hypothetical protein [Bradyrhizobium sp.]
MQAEIQMFRETIALKMNPFGPSFPAGPQVASGFAFLKDLDRMPLRLDQCPDLLGPLFCERILDLETQMERFYGLMNERGYMFGNDAARSTDSALVLIRGAMGSGKTTLGAKMIAEMARLPGGPWASFHVPEPAEDTDPARLAALERLRDSVARVPAGTHVAALVENVSAASLAAAIARFNELQDWPRLFVLTTHNLKLLDADERLMGGAARIEVFTLRQITPADADAYVLHRLPQYRDPHRPEIEELSPVFPFPPGLAGRFVQRGADVAGVPVVMRQLNTHFRRKLAEHATRLRARPNHVSVEKAPPAALAGYLLPEV